MCSEIAAARQTDTVTLRRALERELDWIALKAIEKDRTRRYDTANTLAGDLQRYLNDEPVTARPPSRGYRARKFIARHRMGVGAAAAILVLIAGAAIVILLQSAASSASAIARPWKRRRRRPSATSSRKC